MSGHVGNLSRKQQDALDRFKLNLEDVRRPEISCDRYLLRWLRAREFDIRKAEKMLRAHLAWRVQSGAECIVDDYEMPTAIQEYYPGGFCGHDRQGRPLWVDPVGRGDPKSLARAVTTEEMIRSRQYIMEYIHQVVLPRRSAEEGRPLETIVIIYDMEHLSRQHMWKPGLDCFLEITQLAEQNYPETMGQCFVVNAPPVFPIIFNIVKPFLNTQTQQKIQILGKDYQQELLKHFAPEQLPARFGGSRSDPDGDPRCRDLICYGGVVPPHLHREKPSDVCAVSIPRGGHFSVPLQVTAGQRLQWTFFTDEHDIGFEVCYSGAGDRPRPPPVSSMVEVKNAAGDAVLPMRKVGCWMVPEEGELLCSVGGLYTVRFDNSYSWTRSKKVHYKLLLRNSAAGEETVSLDSFYSAHSHFDD